MMTTRGSGARMWGLLAALLVAGPKVALANDPLTVRASVTPTRARVGDVVTLEVRAVARENGDVDLQLPPLEGLAILGRRESTQMSMSWTSAGQSLRRETILQVELAVETPGPKTIPPVTARLGGRTARSEPVSLQVVGAAGGSDPVRAEGGEVVPPGPGEEPLFIRYRVSRGEAWLGEQILLDLEIFAEPGLGFQVDSIPDPPDLDGFWREVLERPKRLVPRTERVEGRRYQVFRAWRFALFPLSAGKRTLEPIAVSFRLGGSGIFGGGRRARRRTRSLEIDVKPLPEAGRPPGFSPSNVGTYALTAQVEDRALETGKAVVLEVALSGEGNVKSARLPKLETLDGFRVFPPTIEDDVTLRPSGVQGTKRAEILLVPERPGSFTLPALTLPIFDPIDGRYRVLRTEPIPIEVTGAPMAAKTETETEPVAPRPEPGPEDGSDRRPLRYRAELERPPHRPWRSELWWAVLLAGPLGWGGAELARRRAARHRSEREDPARLRREEADAKLDRLLETARAGDEAEIAAAFMEALHARAHLRLGASLKSHTSDEVAQALRAAGGAPEWAASVARALDTASYARYAPGASGEPVEALAARWIELVRELDGLGAGGPHGDRR